MRRAATALVTSALTAGGMAVLAPPASAADITPEPLTITVTNLGPEHRTCHIDADLYVPPGVSKAAPAPAILTTNGFGGTKADQANIAQGMGEHGYVTLAYTGLGFVDHDTCPITLDDREHDGAAASQLISFLGGDPRISAVDQNTGKNVHVNFVTRQDGSSGAKYDPAVGMVGGSYGGQIQFATAGYEHEHGLNRLDTIVPMITWNDLSYSLDPNNQLPDTTATNGSVSSDDPGVFKYEWSLFFTGEGVARGAQDATAITDPAEAQSTFDQLANGQNCANFAPQVCTALTEVATQGYPSQASIDFLRNASVASYMSDIQIPTFLAQGEADTLFNLQESVATYRQLQQQGTPVKLQWQSWGHSNSTPVPGELDQRNPDTTYQGQELVQWFDYYLKHQGTAPTLDFSYFRDWADDGSDATAVAAAYQSAPSYPVGSEQTWYLSGSDTGGSTVDGVSSGGGDLVSDPSAVVPGSSSYTGATFGPNYSETSAVESMLGAAEPPVSDPPGTSIRFLTPALQQPMDVVGSPRLTLQLDPTTSAAVTQAAGPSGQLVVFAKLYDVGPDGTVELPNRLIAPARISDVTQPFTIELPGIVHEFAAGHQLAIVLAGGDLAYRGSTAPQFVSLTTGGTNQQLTIPVAG